VLSLFCGGGKDKGRWCYREERRVEVRERRGNHSERRKKMTENDKIALLIKVKMTRLPMVSLLCQKICVHLSFLYFLSYFKS